MNAPRMENPAAGSASPHSREAEQAVIGALLVDGVSAWEKIASIVSESDFYRDDHRRIFGFIRKLAEAGEHVDFVTVADALERANLTDQTGGLAYLAECANGAVPAGISGHARIVKRDSDRRRLAALGKEIELAAQSADPVGALAAAEGRIAELRSTMQPSESPYKLMTAAELADLPPLHWLVRGVLPCDGLAVLFGASGSGKSFLALDLAAAVADGARWFGNTSKAVPVAYLALEGEAGFSQRAKAWQLHHGRDLPDRLHFVMPASFDLRDMGDVRALADAVIAAGAAGGLLILDTLNRAAAGADENSSSDMGAILAGLKTLQRAVGGLVLAIHHAGKDQTRGMRGHSSLHAAIDAAIEVARTDDRREWVIRKSKDGSDGTANQFKLSVVELGLDDYGELITSCIVEPTEDAGQAVRRVRLPRGGNQKAVYDIAGELLREARHFGQGGAPAPRPCVRLDDLIVACRGRLPCDNDRIPERVRLAVTGLINNGCMAMTEGWIWHP